MKAYLLFYKTAKFNEVSLIG